MSKHNEYSAESILSRFAKHLPDYRERPEQRRMIEEIQAKLEVPRVAGEPVSGENIIVINAPTGSGKSLGYLIAAAPVAIRNKKKLVVSTTTVALQEQLLQKDLPVLVKEGALKVSFTVAKGRGRYACPVKLLPYAAGKTDPGYTPDTSETDTLTCLAKALGNGWNGDRDAWSKAIPDTVWRRVTNDRYGCVGRNCEHFNICPYFQARESLKKSDVIVANHDLVLADLALGGGYLLPNPVDTIYVFDEGHHLPDKCIRSFASEMRLLSMTRRMEKLPATLKRITQALRDSDATAIAQHCLQKAEVIATACQNLVQSLTNYGALQSMSHSPAPMALPIWRFGQSRLPESVEVPGNNIRAAADDCATSINLLRRRLQFAIEQNSLVKPKGEALLAEIGAFLQRLVEAKGVWDLMLSVSQAHQVPVAKWIETIEYETGIDYEVCACRVSAAEILRSRLWERAAGVVITSATLTVQHQFKHFMNRSGLGSMPDTRYVTLQSPFDYENNAKLYIPSMVSDPKNPAAHTAEVIEKLPQLIDQNEGTLVLFTSRVQMEEVYAGLPDKVRAIVLKQGSASREELLKIHGQRISQGGGSILFGLNEFGEGLNLPGKLCKHVVVTKLPFAVHDDPLHAAICEWVERRGGNPFMEVTVPEAVLKLVQFAGRLLRHETDSGSVTILDRRIVSKPYGKVLLKSLPPFQIVVESSIKKVA